MADAATLPKWWTSLQEDKQELYLRLHPQSKMHKVANQAMRDRLAKKPKERVGLRSAIKKISGNVSKYLLKDFHKIDKASENISKQKSEKISRGAQDAIKAKSPKKMLKVITTALAVAGALTIGGGVLATGGLPYVIVAGRLFSDGRQAFKEIHDRIKDGEDATKAVFSTVSNTISKVARDPKMIAAALMLSSRKANDAAAQKPANNDKTDTKEKKTPKRQNVHKPKPKKAVV